MKTKQVEVINKTNQNHHASFFNTFIPVSLISTKFITTFYIFIKHVNIDADQRQLIKLKAKNDDIYMFLPILAVEYQWNYIK